MNRWLTRRAFVRSLVAVVGSLGCLPVKAYSQQPTAPWRIGVILGSSSSPESEVAQAFRQGLRDAGYAEGRDLLIEWRFASGDYARVPALVADLVHRKVDVIVVSTTAASLAVKRATSTIPIVMITGGDPVASSLFASLAHPGGNVTGLSFMTTDLAAKRMQLLKEAIPRLTRVAVLSNPDTLWHAKMVQDLKAVASSLSIELSSVGARTPGELSAAFPAVSRARAQALYVLDDPQFMAHRRTLVEQASKARLPTIYGLREFVDDGGLMSYGANLKDLYRRSAGYVHKILKGAKPGDLPIEQPTKFEFVVNINTAKTLGLTIPESILLQADEVIR